MVAQATGGRLTAGSADRVFAEVSIDSRTFRIGALFVALRGERFDGQAFVQDVIDGGAAGVLVSGGHPSGDAAVIVVPNTLDALQRLGQFVRRRSGARVVAITGSAGKTTTKEVAAEFLTARYRVFRNVGNLNNHFGLPLSLTRLCEGPEIAVVELGMNHAGEIRRLVEIAEPDVRVWTNVGDAHIGHFGSREALADAKAEILELATAGTLLVANADDPLVMSHAGRFAGRVVTFGTSVGATVHATGVVDRGFDGTQADVTTPFGGGRLSLPLAGRAQLSNVLAAVAVAVEHGVPWPEIASRAAALRPVARRGTVTRLRDDARLVDDSYNASPSATRAMLAALAATPVHGRRLAALGEMLELGDAAPALHELCGQAAAEAGVSELIVVGGEAADRLAAGAERGGLARAAIHRFADSASAAAPAAHLVNAGDVMLVKGSRGVRMDVIADRIRLEQEVA
jgi:UDP-N-acetylmuramoyl-tripeptide--D-alanyl-D-alanine ligase